MEQLTILSKIFSIMLLMITYARTDTNQQSFISALNKTAVINSSATTVSNVSTPLNSVILAEGGKINNVNNNQPSSMEHLGREHIVDDKNKRFNNDKAPNGTVAVVNKTSPAKIIPVHEKTDDNTRTKPRKGVNIEDYIKTVSPSTSPPLILPINNVTTPATSVIANKTANTASSPAANIKSTTRTTTSTTSATATMKAATTTMTKTTTTTTKTTTTKPSTKKVVRKPTVTIGSDDEPAVDSKNKSDSLKSKSKETDVPSLEFITENKKHSTDYVVPIVAVILSVPLVAILISVLYKRGSEWWQHRHYRRMDFLIEGMYNN